MSNVVDFNDKKAAAKHRKKEQELNEMRQRFETALPDKKNTPKERLLDIFRKGKPKKR